MNSTKAIFILGALLSAGTLLAQAPDANQPAPTNSPQSQRAVREHRTIDPAKQAAHLGKKLGLSSDQVAQLQPILVDRQQQISSLRADTSLAPKDRHSKAKQIMQDSKNKMEALMTDAQKEQFEQMLAARHQGHNRQPRG